MGLQSGMSVVSESMAAPLILDQRVRETRRLQY